MATTQPIDFERVAPDLCREAARFGAATLHEAAGKIGALPSAIKPMAPAFRIAGPAFTVQGPGGDNLWLHRAIAFARPGDVLVAYANGTFEAGYWGEIMSTAALAMGLGGLVMDGCVRDGDLLPKVGFPVFARGLCIRGTGKDFAAAGRLGASIAIGDATVAAGDLVVGDSDGVVVIPRDRVAQVNVAAAAREAKEADVMAKLRLGANTLDLYGWNR